MLEMNFGEQALRDRPKTQLERRYKARSLASNAKIRRLRSSILARLAPVRCPSALFGQSRRLCSRKYLSTILHGRGPHGEVWDLYRPVIGIQVQAPCYAVGWKCAILVWEIYGERTCSQSGP